jgi:hypothetical protein
MACDCSTGFYCDAALRMSKTEDEAYDKYMASGRDIKLFWAYIEKAKIRRQHRDRALKRNGK